MAQSLPANHIEAHIGDVSGGSQVAVGNYIVQIGRVDGGVVNILNGQPTPPRSRAQPVLLRPRAFPGMLDRETETSNAIQALQSKESVECSGEPGSGKTSLLRHLAYQPQVSNFTAGVVYFQVNQQSNDDLLKSFFDAFYEYDSPVKPTETEIRHYLQALNALILLDDVEITPEQIESLMNVAPNCTFITATSKRGLFGETREVTLKGLPTNEAVTLFQREFGRDLSAEEQKGAQTLCESVDCIPQRVLRAAHEALEVPWQQRHGQKHGDHGGPEDRRHHGDGEGRRAPKQAEVQAEPVDHQRRHVHPVEERLARKTKRRCWLRLPFSMAPLLLRSTSPQLPEFLALRKCLTISKSAVWSSLMRNVMCWQAM